MLLPQKPKGKAKQEDSKKKRPNGQVHTSEEYGSFWRMRRRVACRAFDNAIVTHDKDEDDTSPPEWQDLDPTFDPKLKLGVRELYDLDGPACSATVDDFDDIEHTAEHYCNFTQFVTVILDEEVQCSKNVTWSYAAQVDIDKPKGRRIEMNVVAHGHIVIPQKSKYKSRAP